MAPPPKPQPSAILLREQPCWLASRLACRLIGGDIASALCEPSHRVFHLACGLRRQLESQPASGSQVATCVGRAVEQSSWMSGEIFIIHDALAPPRIVTIASVAVAIALFVRAAFQLACCCCCCCHCRGCCYHCTGFRGSSFRAVSIRVVPIRVNKSRGVQEKKEEKFFARAKCDSGRQVAPPASRAPRAHWPAAVGQTKPRR